MLHRQGLFVIQGLSFHQYLGSIHFWPLETLLSLFVSSAPASSATLCLQHVNVLGFHPHTGQAAFTSYPLTCSLSQLSLSAPAASQPLLHFYPAPQLTQKQVPIGSAAGTPTTPWRLKLQPPDTLIVVGTHSL
jgi:hypothetical protein